MSKIHARQEGHAKAASQANAVNRANDALNGTRPWTSAGASMSASTAYPLSSPAPQEEKAVTIGLQPAAAEPSSKMNSAEAHAESARAAKEALVARKLSPRFFLTPS